VRLFMNNENFLSTSSLLIASDSVTNLRIRPRRWRGHLSKFDCENLIGDLRFEVSIIRNEGAV
jgi:hypothetical protein